MKHLTPEERLDRLLDKRRELSLRLTTLKICLKGLEAELSYNEGEIEHLQRFLQEMRNRHDNPPA